jgi:hypothetical protein
MKGVIVCVERRIKQARRIRKSDGKAKTMNRRCFEYGLSHIH